MYRLLSTAPLLVALGCGADPVERAAAEYVSLARVIERGEDSLERARALADGLSRLQPTPRVSRLKRQAEAIVARYGERTSFDVESRRVYGAVAPPPNLKEAESIRAELDRLLPGEEGLLERYARFQSELLVPREKLRAVFERAVAACRARTLEHIDLPPEERIRVELVSGKDWPSFSEYAGSYESVVRLNVDFPVPIGRVVDIAAHEAYPGHHTASVLVDAHLVREKGLVELSVEPTVGPDALLREGLAAFAEEIVFSGNERLALERDVLFPLAGLDPERADLHATVERLVDRLRPLAVEGARRYVDGKLDRVATVVWLESEAVVPDAWAFLRFVDRHRSYVVAYTAGRDLVRAAAGENPWRAIPSLLLDGHDAT